MKTIYADLSPARVIATRLLGPVNKRAYFGRTAILREEEIPTPRLPGPHWVRVRNRVAGICGSDLHFVFAEGFPTIAPAALPGIDRVYLGHEMVGYVVEVGSAVTEVRVGDRVAAQRAGNCCLGRGDAQPCRFCAEGSYNLCERPVDQDGAHSIGGGWSDEWIAPVGRLYQAPVDLSDEDALLLEPAGSGVRAALRHRPAPGDRVLVIGCGTQGLVTIAALKIVQPDCEVTALARFPHQAEVARRYGASNLIMLGRGDPYEDVASLTGGQLYRGMLGTKAVVGGFDAVYDCVGKPNTLRDALRWARARGTVVMVGIHLAPMRIDLTPVFYWEVDLIGVLAHGAEEWEGQRYSTFDLMVKWLREGKLTFEGLITHRFKLSEYREAILTNIQQGERRAIKVIFDMRDAAERRSDDG